MHLPLGIPSPEKQRRPTADFSGCEQYGGRKKEAFQEQAFCFQLGYSVATLWLLRLLAELKYLKENGAILTLQQFLQSIPKYSCLALSFDTADDSQPNTLQQVSSSTESSKGTGS